MIYLCFKNCESDSESRHDAGISARDRLFELFGLSVCDVYFSEAGKPLCRDASFCFSVSHSAEVAVCALKCNIELYDVPDDVFVIFENLPSSSIGVDIEDASSSISEEKMRRVSKRFLGCEITEKADFLRAWTRGEAYGKFTGAGIRDAKNITSDRTFYSFKIEVFDTGHYLSVCI